MNKMVVTENFTQLLVDAASRANLSAYSTDAGPSVSHDSEIASIVSKIVAILFGFIGITGLLGNAMVVLVVLSNPQMRSTTNLLIINLAIADLLFVVFCIPFTATDYVLDSWPFGDLWCKIVQYLIVVTAHASIYTLVLMSLDRFLAVVHPIASMVIRTERNTVLAITVLWIVIITTAIPVPFAHGVSLYTDDSYETEKCGFLENDNFSWAAFHIAFFLSSYVVPLILISVLYMWMLSRLWRSSVGGRSAESKKGKKRVTRLVVIVVAAFASLWCPIQVILLLKSIDAFETVSPFHLSLQIISHVLAYTSSCINPLLYAFLSENFRKAFRKIVYCGPGSRRHGSQRHMPLPTKTTRTGSCPDIL
ncbi:allatostatin-A receptor-like [Anopheles albimanus]|uniref:allatostatin-A receptor-like n=1 Tax=Anopheles albimanus TaxID=7167 RepID=UPI00163F2A87|nr:allatostatin-A receptor-like [Anopheles albimanus]XP_035780122.1 allatostatin-A receptor-like [Anopheles albimanus]